MKLTINFHHRYANNESELTTRTGRLTALIGAMTLTERQSSDSGALLSADSAKKGCALISFCKIDACPPAVPDVELCCEHCAKVDSVRQPLKYEANRDLQPVQI